MDNIYLKTTEKRSLFLDIFVFLIIIFLFYLVITQYYPTASHEINNAINKILREFPEKYPEHYKEVNKLSDEYPQTVTAFNFIRTHILKDYTLQYKYLDYAELKEEYNSIIIPNDHIGNYSISNSIVVLNYHGTVANHESSDEFSIPVENFKEHMFALKKAGYKTVTLEDLYKFMRGEKQLTEKHIVITFDDGLKETYYNVDPILKLLDYNAVMFVITHQSLEKNSKYYLNVDELWEMQKNNRWDIQAHGHEAHDKIAINGKGDLGAFLTNKKWIKEKSRLETNEEFEKRIRSDLVTTKALLQKEFGKQIIGFALPFGDFGQRESNYHESQKIVIDITEDLYNMVFYQFKPTYDKDFRANYNNNKDNFYLIMRISADSIRSADNLMKEIEAAKEIRLPYNEKFDNKKRWINLWGNIDFKDANLLIKETGIGSAFAYLDGSYLWKDYSFSIKINENNALKNMLIVRFQNAENYAGCKFNENRVSIFNVKNNERITVNEIKIDGSISAPVHLKASVKRNILSCYIGDKKIIQATIPQMQPNGGIGIRIEEFNPNMINVFTDVNVNEN